MCTRHSASPPAALPAALAGMRAFGLVGLNVTVPHKQAVMAHLDELSAEAQSIGAVNTIANRDGRLVGYNTDAFGIVQSLKVDGGLARLPPKVALLGAGGRGRGLCSTALLARDEVEEVLLLNRTVAKAAAPRRGPRPRWSGASWVAGRGRADWRRWFADQRHVHWDAPPPRRFAAGGPVVFARGHVGRRHCVQSIRDDAHAARCCRWSRGDQRLGDARLARCALVCDLDRRRAAG